MTVIQDPRANLENTEAVEGAPHVHFHHRASDMSVSSGGRPCCVEVVCHGCHESALFFFRTNRADPQLRPLRAAELYAKRDEFVTAHARCPAERIDWTRSCDARRSGEPRVFDLAGALG